MIMFSEFVDTNQADRCDSGYILLYPLLNLYWEKQLTEMPQTLRLRVKRTIPGWDKTEGSYPNAHNAGQLTIRQKRVRSHDIKRDPTQEWKTYIALEGYIRGGYSPTEYPLVEYEPDGNGFLRSQLADRIDETNNNGRTSVAVALRDDVVLPLEIICREVGIHWPNPEPRLWEALCKFDVMTLPSLKRKAKEENNDQLVIELEYVSTYIYRILNLDRDRMDERIESELKANAAAQAISAPAKSEWKINTIIRTVHSLAKYEKRYPVGNQQDDAILKWLCENGYDPLKLPEGENGKAGLRKSCGDAVCIKKDGLFNSRKIFFTAWDRVRANGGTKKIEK